MTEAAVNDQPASDDAEPDAGSASGRVAEPSAALAAYTRIYEEHNARLVAYARTLTGNPATAEDLVAEAHFRVWRRISGGHAVENVPAYLATTIRNLANTLHRATTEIPLPTGPTEPEFGNPTPPAEDPSQQVAHVDYVTRLLKDLPERWVQALWLAEVEDLPLETVGQRIGANSNATAVLLNRAREGLRQAFLRGYPGAPATEACASHWQKMPSLVRGSLSARQTDSLRAHAEQCDDCRARLAALQQVNLRLPALLGPALLLLGLGGGSLRVFAAVGGAKAAGTHHLLHVGSKVRHGVAGGGGKAAVVSAGVLSSTAIAVAAVALAGGAAHPPAAPHKAAETQQPGSQPAAPVTKATSAKPAAKPTPTTQPVQYTPRHAAPKISPTQAAPPAQPAAAPPTQAPAMPATPPPTTTSAPATPTIAPPPSPPPTPIATQPPATPPSTPPPSTTPPTKPDHDDHDDHDHIDITVTIPPHLTVTVTVPHTPPGHLSSKSPG